MVYLNCARMANYGSRVALAIKYYLISDLWFCIMDITLVCPKEWCFAILPGKFV